MSRQTDTPMTTPLRRGRRRVAIIGLASLTALTIAVPPSAPWTGAGAIILLFIGLWNNLWNQPTDPATTPKREHREPSLWDDGFGANSS